MTTRGLASLVLCHRDDSFCVEKRTWILRLYSVRRVFSLAPHHLPSPSAPFLVASLTYLGPTSSVGLLVHTHYRKSCRLETLGSAEKKKHLPATQNERNRRLPTCTQRIFSRTGGFRSALKLLPGAKVSERARRVQAVEHHGTTDTPQI